MSAQETKPTETKEIAKGLQIRKFAGSITDPEKKGTDGKALVVANFTYPRIVFPWSRTGEDIDKNKPEGAVPSLAEVLAGIQASGYSVEIELNKDNEPSKVSVVQLLCDGWNAHENRIARAKAENTPDSAKAKAISVYAKMLGLSLQDAEKQLFPSA